MRRSRSATSTADPAAIVTAAFGTGVSILVLFVVMHGPVATNILNLYFMQGPLVEGREPPSTSPART